MGRPSAHTGGVELLDSTKNLVSLSDEMFFALEGQHVESRGELWRLEVCSVYSNGIDYWVQLDLSGPVRCGLTVRTPRPDAQGVLAIVGAWLDDSVPSHVEECLVGKTYSPAVRL